MAQELIGQNKWEQIDTNHLFLCRDIFLSIKLNIVTTPISNEIKYHKIKLGKRLLENKKKNYQ